jgi:hypothetical protein
MWSSGLPLPSDSLAEEVLGCTSWGRSRMFSTLPPRLTGVSAIGVGSWHTWTPRPKQAEVIFGLGQESAVVGSQASHLRSVSLGIWNDSTAACIAPWLLRCPGANWYQGQRGSLDIL